MCEQCGHLASGRGLQSPVLAFKALVWTNLSWSVSCDHLNFKEVKYDHWNTPLKLYWKIFFHSKLTQPQQLAAFKVFISCDFVRVTQHIQQTRASVWSCVPTPSLVSTKSWEIRKSGSLATRCLNVFTSLMATLSVCYLMLDRWPNQTKPNQTKASWKSKGCWWLVPTSDLFHITFRVSIWSTT